MIKKYRSLMLLLLITAFAFLLRVSLLGVVPSSPNWDEVSLGYNAYSLFHTGCDEYGKFLPVVLRSYDDYKPALYTYLVIPSMLLFGLTTFAVRFPSAFFGTLTVFAVYFLVRELFGKEKIVLRGKEISPRTLGLVAAFLLAISPWHIQFSRIAFESNVGVAFNVFAVLFFLKGLKKHQFLLLSAFCFGLVPSIYQSDKVFTPLLFMLTIAVFWRSVKAVSRKYILFAVVVGFITLLPVIYFHLTDKQALARASGVSVFADQASFLKETSGRLLIDRQNNDVLGLVFDNRRVEFVKVVIAGYLSHFDLNWLFVYGDLPRHHAPFMGLLYLWELPFLFLGFYLLLFGRFPKSTKLLILGWFFLAPLPASFTSGVPHAVRTLNFLPTFQIFVALGIIGSFVAVVKMKYHIAKIQIKYFVFVFYLLFIIFNFSYYINQYFIQQNYYTSIDWQYGYKEAIEEIKKREGDYTKIIVTNKPPLDQSYMFFLFYLHYPPDRYQKEAQNASGGFRENHTFGKYEFRPILWENEKKDKNTLYVGRPGDFPEKVKKLKTIRYINGVEAIEIVQGS